MLGRLFTVFGTLFLAGSACAAPAELNGVTVTEPRKWSAGERDAMSMLWQRTFEETGEEEQGAALIQLIVPSRVSGSLAHELSGLVGAIGNMKDEDPLIDETGSTADGHEMVVQYRCCGEMKGLDVDLSSVAVGSPQRQAYLQLVMLNLADERQDEVEQTFAEVVRSLRLTSEDKGFRVAPQPSDGGLDGVFTYHRTGLSPNVIGGLDFTADSELRLFSPDGIFTTQLPAEGVELEEHCARFPDTCGTYRVSGGGWFTKTAEIEISSVADEFGRISTQTQPFAKRGDNILIGEEEHRRVPPFSSDTQFNGEWRYFFASSGMSATSSGSIAVERFLTLTPDGRFERSGWSGASSTMDTGGGTSGVTTSSDTPTSSGSYQVDGHTLTLIGPRGETEKLSIFAPDVGSDELLVIDGNNYLKQD